jgi:transglutaminase-like putative cysteine protease
MNQDVIENKRNLRLLIPAAALLISSSIFFGITADLPHVPFFTIVLVVFSLFRRKPVKFNDRTLIYSVVSVLVLTILFDFVFPIDTNRFGLVSYFLRPQLSVPLLLFSAAVLSMFNIGGWIPGIAAGVAFATIMMGGDLYVATVNERLPMFDFVLSDVKRYYTGMILVLAAMTLLAFRLAVPVALIQASKKMRIFRNLLLLFFLAVLPIASFGLIKLINYYSQELRSMENFFIRRGSRWRGRGSHQFFSNRVNLRSTVGAHMDQNRNQVVMRVYTPKTPGYLRAQAYLKYLDGAWAIVADKAPEGATKGGASSNVERLSEKQHEGVLSFKTFWYQAFGDKRKNPCMIVPASGFHSKVLPIPADAGCFDIIADQVMASQDGVITPEDWTKDGGYTAYAPAYTADAAYQYPNPIGKPAYLEVHEELRKPLQKVLDKILAKSPQRKLSDRAAAGLIISHFLNNYKYKIAEYENYDVDPVINFLTNSDQGHCELFAASMTLLLRQHGIPARYVTGFVCVDQHPSKRYFATRVGNAHAWVEGYMRDEKKWVLLEPTPPSGVPNFKGEWGMVNTWTDRVSGFLRMLLADMRNGFYAKAIVAVFSGLFDLLYDFLIHPLRGTLFLLFMYWLWRHWRKKRKVLHELELPPERLTAVAEFEQLRCLFAREFKLSYNHDMTPLDFSVAASTAAPDLAGEMDEFIQLYLKLRFGSELPGTQALDELKLVGDGIKLRVKKRKKS